LGKISLDLLEDKFLKSSTVTYDLSILINMDRFSFMISDTQQNVLALKVYELNALNEYTSAYKDELQKVFIADAYLKLPYQQVRVAIGHSNNVFVPNNLYHPGHKQTYLSHLTHLPKEATISIDELKKMEAKNVYWLEEGIGRLLRSYFSTSRLYHCSTPALYGFRRIAKHLMGHSLFLNVAGKTVHLALFEDGKFQFSNVFSFQNSRDFIYYVMLIYDQFQLKPEKVPVYIAGQIVEDSEIYHLLYRYIRHLNMVQSPDYLHFDKKHSSVPAHFYFDLYSMKLCE